jgi:hypothetical protein
MILLFLQTWLISSKAHKQELSPSTTEGHPSVISLLSNKAKQQSTISSKAPFRTNPPVQDQKPATQQEPDIDMNDNEQMRLQYDNLTGERCELIQEIAELKGGTGSQALEDEVERLLEQVGRMKDVVRYIEREMERERERQKEKEKEREREKEMEKEREREKEKEKARMVV